MKFFPASVLGAAGITAIRAVLPAGIMIAAVGGVSDANFAEYLQTADVWVTTGGNDLTTNAGHVVPVAVRAQVTALSKSISAPLTGWDLDLSGIHDWFRA